MSGLTNLNHKWYNDTEYQNYAFEYTPGEEGQVTWFVGEEKTWTVDARAVGPNGNIGQRVVPTEPLAIVMNLGMSHSFAPIDDDISKTFPGIMRFDFVRIYQDPEHESVTCDPPGFETTEYIAKHPAAYQNVNKTLWCVLPFPSLSLTGHTNDPTLGLMLDTTGRKTPSCMGVRLLLNCL